MLSFTACTEGDGAEGADNAPQPDESTPVVFKSIEITNSDVSFIEGTGKVVMLRLDDEGRASYQITFRYFAHHTLDESDALKEGNDPSHVRFVYDTALNCATVSDTGLVTFTKSGVMNVKVLPANGDDVMDEITVIARRG